MTWIEKLQMLKFGKGKSQSDEAGIISFIFENIQPVNKFFVDIGAGYYGYGQMSNTQELIDKGWDGIRVDAENKDDLSIMKLYVTPENIVPFLNRNEVPIWFDFLSIDIDSFDLDILEEIIHYYQPGVICTEFNATLDPETSVKLKYEPGYIWDETNKYGYSFGAAVKFCNKYGYKIILNQDNQNLFLVRSDLVGDVPVIEAEQVFYHPVNELAEWEDY